MSQQYEMKGAPGEQPPPGYGAQPPAQYPPSQPQTVVMVREGDQVQDNMVISIISIFFCCILGIIATVKASNVKTELRRGDIAAAQEHSTTARKLAIAAIITGSVLLGIVIIVYFIIPLALGLAWGIAG